MHDKLSHSPALSHLGQKSLFPHLGLRPSYQYRTKHGVHRAWYYLQFQVSTGESYSCPPWIRGNYIIEIAFRSFPGGSDQIESTCNVGYLGWIPGSGRSPGEGHGNPLQCSCLENPMDRGAWWATVRGVAESDITLQLNHHHNKDLRKSVLNIHCKDRC